MGSKNIFMALIIVAAMVCVGCSTTKVTRVELDKKVDLSGYWNDTDALLVSEEMVKDCLHRPWYNRFMEQESRDPVVIVGHVTNRSHEHINAQVFTKYLEKELLNSGKVVFVASSEERDQIRQEREEQQKGFTDQKTIKEFGKEKGADFMLIGSIDSVKDEVKGKFVIFYQVNLELVDLKTNGKVWIGQKQIKKIAEKKKFSL